MPRFWLLMSNIVVDPQHGLPSVLRAVVSRSKPLAEQSMIHFRLCFGSVWDGVSPNSGYAYPHLGFSLRKDNSLLTKWVAGLQRPKWYDLAINLCRPNSDPPGNSCFMLFTSGFQNPRCWNNMTSSAWKLPWNCAKQEELTQWRTNRSLVLVDMELAFCTNCLLAKKQNLWMYESQIRDLKNPWCIYWSSCIQMYSICYCNLYSLRISIHEIIVWLVIHHWLLVDPKTRSLLPRRWTCSPMTCEDSCWGRARACGGGTSQKDAASWNAQCSNFQYWSNFQKVSIKWTFRGPMFFFFFQSSLFQIGSGTCSWAMITGKPLANGWLPTPTVGRIGCPMRRLVPLAGAWWMRPFDSSQTPPMLVFSSGNQKSWEKNMKKHEKTRLCQFVSYDFRLFHICIISFRQPAFSEHWRLEVKYHFILFPNTLRFCCSWNHAGPLVDLSAALSVWLAAYCTNYTYPYICNIILYNLWYHIYNVTIMYNRYNFLDSEAQMFVSCRDVFRSHW